MEKRKGKKEDKDGLERIEGKPNKGMREGRGKGTRGKVE